ncbi:hypothetical protein GCM10007857_44490 [Bradyrhizobium iriomotense]|uniref:Uncharacterized protein n=1 Tax=Bradyrhizobium iriomotense TaxID=441950 RepID=A0ABQ6B1P8_9BRAD|nr:hypothetical protein GCM10007857_44490 [Bradyrhizobium iriomotense]
MVKLISRIKVAMEPKKYDMKESGDLIRTRLDQIITMKHELVKLVGKVDRD